MTARVGYSTPMPPVAEVENSIRFYELLGFETIDTDRCAPIGWTRLHCEGGAVMFLRADVPVVGVGKGVMLYMYTPDLAGLRDQLVAAGIKVPLIKHPPYMPSGEMQFTDPDGYLVLIAHWGKAEQEAWEKRIGVKQ
jgi:hypothetical protein